MGVVALTEQLDNPWNLARVLEQQESERRDGSTADVVGRVRDGDMKEFPYSIIVGCSGIGQRERVDTAVAQDRILGARQFVGWATHEHSHTFSANNCLTIPSASSCRP